MQTTISYSQKDHHNIAAKSGWSSAFSCETLTGEFLAEYIGLGYWTTSRQTRNGMGEFVREIQKWSSFEFCEKWSKGISEGSIFNVKQYGAEIKFEDLALIHQCRAYHYEGKLDKAEHFPELQKAKLGYLPKTRLDLIEMKRKNEIRGKNQWALV
jgi:hypothetical protein